MPYVSLHLEYRGARILVSNVLVDTGSGSTAFKADVMAEIGVEPESRDRLRNMWGVGGSEAVFRRTVDLILIGGATLPNWTIDVARMNYGFEINGIVGMDVLRALGARLDLALFQMVIPGRRSQ